MIVSHHMRNLFSDFLLKSQITNQVLVFSFFHVFIKRSLKELNIFDSDNGIIDIPVVAFARVYFVSFQL